MCYEQPINKWLALLYYVAAAVCTLAVVVISVLGGPA